LFTLEAVREGFGEVANHAFAGVDHARPLADGERVDTGAPPLDHAGPQLGELRRGNTLDEQVQVERSATLELDLHEPLDPGPTLAERFPEVPQVVAALAPRQVLARGEDEPERRRVFGRVEEQHLDRLLHVDALAVPAEVRGAAATAHDLARGREEPNVLGPPLTDRPLRGVCTNSLSLVKATGPDRGGDAT
jgi:hypothetical protein